MPAKATAQRTRRPAKVWAGLATVLGAPDLREKLAVEAIEAIEPMVMSPKQFAAFIKVDITRWTRLAKDRNIALDS